ncbi:hypothetical protein GCM10009530_37130 [Microbispora corallina]|uniref:SnoaL-like domain-containing protein n=1 Tax=Microbispora corallina TaxID=83302 RepID=A0ABQ4G269_9ACTN|nr:nuclear transport factor 2 family protein [Microbispora corallina]GIH41162.1 hypothetical protein Mco01_41620 [Microbispora corallina]
MTSAAGKVVARYFEMWNTGDTSIAPEVLAPDWLDHAHPEAGGPESVARAVERVRETQPDLTFRVDAVLGDGDLVAVVGAAGRDGAGTPLIWLVRVQDDRMAEMWTYRRTQ